MRGELGGLVRFDDVAQLHVSGVDLHAVGLDLDSSKGASYGQLDGQDVFLIDVKHDSGCGVPAEAGDRDTDGVGPDGQLLEDSRR